MTDNEAWTKAEEHWAFLERWMHMLFVDAFVHGFKHGLERATVAPSRPAARPTDIERPRPGETDAHSGA